MLFLMIIYVSLYITIERFTTIRQMAVHCTERQQLAVCAVHRVQI